MIYYIFIGGKNMNTLNKILIVVTVILTIALGIMTYEYFTLRQTSKNNTEDILKHAEELYEANKRINELEAKLEAYEK